MKRSFPPKQRKSRSTEKGSALIEFALCLSLFWVPLFLGTYQIGFNLVRAVQVTQVCRDAGHIYSQKSDLSASSYQQVLSKLMPTSFQMTASGNTALHLSIVTFVDGQACYQGGLVSDPASANSTNCPNYNKAVFMRQIPYGNTSLRSSDFGTPNSNIMDSNYNISTANYLKDPSAVANGFLSVINLTSSSQYAYVAEMYVHSTDLSFWSSLGTTGEYARSVF